MTCRHTMRQMGSKRTKVVNGMDVKLVNKKCKYCSYELMIVETKWPQKLKQAKKDNRFTDLDRRYVNSWMLCALGTKLNLIEYNDNSNKDFNFKLSKFDKDLYILGVNFTFAVMENDIDNALQYYKAISKFRLSYKKKKALKLIMERNR